MRLLLAAFACCIIATTTSCVGKCTDPVERSFTMADGGVEKCLCRGPCGCGGLDGGLCVYGNEE